MRSSKLILTKDLTMSNDTFYITPDTNNLFGHLNKYDIYYKGVAMSISEQKIKELMIDYVTIMEEHSKSKGIN